MSRLNIICASFILFLISAASAFVAAPTTQFGATSALPILHLHPDQAPDLEAYAYVYLKETVAKKLDEEYRATEASSRPQRRGPIAWCKNVWSRTSTSGETPRTSSSSLHQQKP